MLAKIDLANQEIRTKAKDVCVGSGDVISLYPSLRHRDSARLCGELIAKCPAKFEGIDYQAAGVFLATHCSAGELKLAGLAKVVPARKYKFGFAPTASTPELTTRSSDPNQAPTKFSKVSNNITEEEKRLMLAKVVETGVYKVMRNHVYLWRNEYWLQSLGVPTGLRLSGIVGRITMDSWRSQIRVLMNENAMVTYLLEKYVDDTEVVVENVEVGTRWDGRALVISPESAQEDLDLRRSREEITMGAWASMASSVIPGLSFTMDYPANNNNSRMPMLDFELWREKEPDPCKPGELRESLRYNFFEKKVTNPRVMDKSSAMPHSMKMATLMQEGVRRLCNSSRELPHQERCATLSLYMRKLQLSGYNTKLRSDILQAAVTTFRRKERAEVLGIVPVHRLGGHNLAQSRREKLLEKKDWFRPKATSWKARLNAREKELESSVAPQEEGGVRESQVHASSYSCSGPAAGPPPGPQGVQKRQVYTSCPQQQQTCRTLRNSSCQY